MNVSEKYDIVQKRVANVILFRQSVEDIQVLIGDRYLIEVLEIEDETESGIALLSDELSRAYEIGKVIVVGNGDRLETDTRKEMYWAKGDVIAFERLGGRKILISGKQYRIVSQTHTYFRFSPAVVRKVEGEVASANQASA